MRQLGYGQMVIRQSDLASFMYCGMQQHLDDVAKDGGYVERRLSQTIFGTVMHYAGQHLQLLHHQGAADALDRALATFEHYWHPDHVDEVADGRVTDWLPGQTWSGMLQRGRRTLRGLYEWLQKDKSTLLALEHTFTVATVIDGEPVTLTGTADRLNLRVIDKAPVLGVDDLKTAVKPVWLQHALQWTFYSYASTRPEFWLDFVEMPAFLELESRVRSRGLALWAEPPAEDRGLGLDSLAATVLADAGLAGRPTLPLAARRGRWLNIRGTSTERPGQDDFKVSDVGWRTPEHYARMHVAIREFMKAQRAEVFPLTVSGKTCHYCPWSHGVCGNAPLPEFQEGIDR